MGDVVLPRFTHKRNRPARHPQVNFQEQYTANTDIFHRTQVGDHLVAILVAIHEVPVDARTCRSGRISEGVSELVGVKASGEESESAKKIGCGLLHGSGSSSVES
jgi:hypothetical protein